MRMDKEMNRKDIEWQELKRIENEEGIVIKTEMKKTLLSSLYYMKGIRKRKFLGFYEENGDEYRRTRSKNY